MHGHCEISIVSLCEKLGEGVGLTAYPKKKRMMMSNMYVLRGKEHESKAMNGQVGIADK